MLRLKQIHSHYGQIHALKGVSLEVKEGSICCLIGANGAGKSTTLMSISGIQPITSGHIEFQGKPINSRAPEEIVRRGIVQVPEGRRIFPLLTVQENLNMGAFVRKDLRQVEKTREWVCELFPILQERKDQLAGTLSGGEQQMLAIGRGLMNHPRILLLDEPSLGLAPLLVKAIFRALEEINKTGMTILFVEQNARAALKLANRGYVMELGQIVLQDSSKALLANPNVQNAYLGGSRT